MTDKSFRKGLRLPLIRRVSKLLTNSALDSKNPATYDVLTDFDAGVSILF
jgi:hypothetical protein